MSLPLYLVLGSSSAGRRGVCLDTINRALNDDDFCTVFVSESEKPSESDKRIASSQHGGFVRYKDAKDAFEKLQSLDESQISHVFFLVDSTRNLADAIEEAKDLIDGKKIRLAAIWGVLDCGMLARFPEQCQTFADALSHFSDALLLSRRDGLSNRQVADIKARYEKQCKPHHYFYVDSDLKVDKPIELMIEEARRISVIFDDFDPIDDLDIDENNLPEEPFDLERKPDPYLERQSNGARVRPIPDVREFAALARNAQKTE